MVKITGPNRITKFVKSMYHANKPIPYAKVSHTPALPKRPSKLTQLLRRIFNKLY